MLNALQREDEDLFRRGFAASCEKIYMPLQQIRKLVVNLMQVAEGEFRSSPLTACSNVLGELHTRTFTR